MSFYFLSRVRVAISPLGPGNHGDPPREQRGWGHFHPGGAGAGPRTGAGAGRGVILPRGDLWGPEKNKTR
jgi:hypothetical protein